MLVEVKVPTLAESVPDATLLSWRVNPGDTVKQGDNLIDLETDKVTLEVVATADGVVKELKRKEGERVIANDVLAVLATGEATSTVQPPSRDEEAGRMGPAVRKLIKENNLDISKLEASTGDRITKADVLTYLSSQTPKVPETSESVVAEALPPAVQVVTDKALERRVPMSRLRQTAAQRLLAAQRNNAILTTFNEINMQPVMDLRNRYRQRFEERHSAKLGFMSFFVKASVAALQRFPVVNASVADNDIVYHDYCDIGIAVASSRGLVVPVLRQAESMSFASIEQRIREFGERAGQGKLTLDDLSGGTFTITNGGTFGSLLSTPILNPPQSAILGMHKIEDRPVAEAGQVVIRPMMYVALSYDHRIIDGREAVQFLVTVKEALEDPMRLLIEV